MLLKTFLIVFSCVDYSVVVTIITEKKGRRWRYEEGIMQYFAHKIKNKTVVARVYGMERAVGKRTK